MWKEFPISFFYFAGTVFFVPSCNKKQNRLDELKYEEKGSSETLNCFHSSLNFGQWMAKLKHLGALPINFVPPTSEWAV